ncbi:MAG: cation diffusion facilitator family transporter [Spirochaetota bacterium]
MWTKHSKRQGCHHHHGNYHLLPARKRQKMQRRLLVTIAINIGITLTEIIIGIWAASMALLVDALHNFSDVLALILSLIGLYLLGRKAQNEQTFGYQRVELVIGLINAISLIFIGLLALRPALEFFIRYAQNYVNGVPNSYDTLGLPIFIASLISIIFNGLSVYILERGEHNSISTRSSVLHLFSDMLTSMAVCFAGIMIYFFGIYWLDPFVSLIISGYILTGSFSLAKRSIQMLLNFNVTGIDVQDIRLALCEEPEIYTVSHVHLWSLSESTIMLEAHVGVSADLSVSALSGIKKKLKNILFQKFHISHVTLEFHAAISGRQECQFET